MDTQQLVQELDRMTNPQIVALTKQLEELWGVKAVPQAPEGPRPPVPPQPDDQTEFTVVLTSAGANKIGIIKIVREVIPGFGLKEAKELVESTPKTIREGLSKADAVDLQKKFTEAGATVQVK